MEINKLSTHLNGQIDGNRAAEQNQAAARVGNNGDSKSVSDKVSLSSNGVKTSDEQFAKIELDKANSASFSKLKEYKAKIQEYDAARQVSKEAAQQTELGKMLNDPAVWEKMADNMFR